MEHLAVGRIHPHDRHRRIVAAGVGDLEDAIIAPLAREAEARHQTIRARAAATKVDFFTVAREAGA